MTLLCLPFFAFHDAGDAQMHVDVVGGVDISPVIPKLDLGGFGLSSRCWTSSILGGTLWNREQKAGLEERKVSSMVGIRLSAGGKIAAPLVLLLHGGGRNGQIEMEKFSKGLADKMRRSC